MSTACVPLDKKVVDLSEKEIKEIHMRQEILVQEEMTRFWQIFFPGYEPKKNYAKPNLDYNNSK